MKDLKSGAITVLVGQASILGVPPEDFTMMRSTAAAAGHLHLLAQHVVMLSLWERG